MARHMQMLMSCYGGPLKSETRNEIGIIRENGRIWPRPLAHYPIGLGYLIRIELVQKSLLIIPAYHKAVFKLN